MATLTMGAASKYLISDVLSDRQVEDLTFYVTCCLIREFPQGFVKVSAAAVFFGEEDFKGGRKFRAHVCATRNDRTTSWLTCYGNIRALGLLRRKIKNGEADVFKYNRVKHPYTSVMDVNRALERELARPGERYRLDQDVTDIVSDALKSYDWSKPADIYKEIDVEPFKEDESSKSLAELAVLSGQAPQPTVESVMPAADWHGDW